MTGGQWTDEQLLHGIDLLEQARRSWVAARDGADVRTHQPEDRYNRPLSEDGVSYGVWLTTYFGADTNAEQWGVADLGTCTACSHLLVAHGLVVGCWGCVSTGGVGWERSCQLPSPLLHERPMIPRPR